MAVDFKTISQDTQLYQKYNSNNEKLLQVRQTLIDNNCDVTILQDIDNLISSHDGLVQNAVDMVMSVGNTLLNIADCLNPASGNKKQQLQDAMLKRANDALDAKDLEAVESKIDEMIAAIDSGVDNLCDVLAQLIIDASNAVQESVDKVLNAINVSIEFDDLTKDVSKAFAKVASIINCITDAIVQDDKLVNVIDNVSPEISSTLKIVREQTKANINPGHIMENAKQLLNDEMGIDNKYTDYATRLMA
jgi:gas vesicle protein